MPERSKLTLLSVLRRSRENKPVPKEPKTWNPLWITAIATLGATLMTSLFGFVVDTQKQESVDSIKRAEMFTQLLGSIKDNPEDPYPLLSLWKIYPNDRRLIVITALQEPTEKTSRLLLQIFDDNDLAAHTKEIRDIYMDATDETRKHIGALYRALDPDGQIDVLLDQIAALPKVTGDENILTELRPLIADSAAAKEQVATRVQNTPPDRMDVKIVLALILVDMGNADPMRDILQEIRTNFQNFSILHETLKNKNLFRIDEALKVDMLKLAQEYTDHVRATSGGPELLMDTVELMNKVYPAIDVPSLEDEQRFVSTLVGILRHDDTDNWMRNLTFEALIERLYQTEAEDAFLMITLCDQTADLRQRAYGMLLLQETIFDQALLNLHYDDALPILNAQLQERGLSCAT